MKDQAPPPISAMFWVNGMVVSLMPLAGPIVLASLTWNETGDQYYSPKLWYYAGADDIHNNGRDRLRKPARPADWLGI